MKFDTVLFDLDGTLLDTLTDLTESVNKALVKEGCPPRTEQEVRSYLGNGAKMLIWSSLPDGAGEEQVNRCLEIYRPIYKKNMSKNTCAYDGITDLLEELSKAGVKMGVVSNKPDAPCKALVAEIFGGEIKVALGDRDDIPRKPDRAPVFTVLEMLGSKPENAVYVGDSEVDVHTARNAGMPSVAVTWGFRDREIFEEEGADYIIDHPLQLLDILKNS